MASLTTVKASGLIRTFKASLKNATNNMHQQEGKVRSLLRVTPSKLPSVVWSIATFPLLVLVFAEMMIELLSFLCDTLAELDSS